jgi:hypothetical protein
LYQDGPRSSKDQLILSLRRKIEHLEKMTAEQVLQIDMLKEESFQQRITIYKYKKKEAEMLEEAKAKNSLNYNESEEGQRIYKNFDIELSQGQQAELAIIPGKSRSDSKFVFKLLDFVFSKHELANASLTGNISKNPNYEAKV